MSDHITDEMVRAALSVLHTGWKPTASEWWYVTRDAIAEALAFAPTVDGWVLCKRPDLKPYPTKMSDVGGCGRWGPRCPGPHHDLLLGPPQGEDNE